jgi:hypothetical protein
MSEYRKPAFIITLDTEGDDIWSRPQTPATENARFLPRFQSLCESYGLRPTYLTDYEMAGSEAFKEFASDMLKRKTGEVGMHLHAWDMPPDAPLTSDDCRYHPYLIEYSDDVMRRKIDLMTDLLEDTFGVKMLSHRAGRWAFDERYAGMLVERGYRADCSVTPHVSWRRTKGDPNGIGGTDYRAFPEREYWVSLDDIRREGDSPLLEVPVTIMRHGSNFVRSVQDLLGEHRIAEGVLRRCFGDLSLWLRPNGHNRSDLIDIVRRAAAEQRSYVEFMIHSSELMPGGSPYFPDDNAVQGLYDDLEALYAIAQNLCIPSTLSEFSGMIAEQHKKLSIGTDTEVR